MITPIDVLIHRFVHRHRGRRYDTDAVDAALRGVIDHLHHVGPLPLLGELPLAKHFRCGYDGAQVDAYLDRLWVEDALDFADEPPISLGS